MKKILSLAVFMVSLFCCSMDASDKGKGKGKYQNAIKPTNDELIRLVGIFVLFGNTGLDPELVKYSDMQLAGVVNFFENKLSKKDMNALDHRGNIYNDIFNRCKKILKNREKGLPDLAASTMMSISTSMPGSSSMGTATTTTTISSTSMNSNDIDAITQLTYEWLNLVIHNKPALQEAIFQQDSATLQQVANQLADDQFNNIEGRDELVAFIYENIR